MKIPGLLKQSLSYVIGFATGGYLGNKVCEFVERFIARRKMSHLEQAAKSLAKKFEAQRKVKALEEQVGMMLMSKANCLGLFTEEEVAQAGEACHAAKKELDTARQKLDLLFIKIANIRSKL